MKTLQASCLEDTSKLYGILFWAPWAEPSLMVEQLLDDQAEEYPAITFGKLNVEEVAELVTMFGVSSVPTVVFLKSNKIVGKVVGSDPVELVQTLSKVSSLPEEKPLDERLKALINRAPIMVFIKGTPTAPRCGFTRTLLNLLAENSIEYDYFDILSDEEVRQGLKVYSDWPTYPQIYVQGELLGGLDIFTEMVQTNQLQDILNSINNNNNA